MTIEKCQWHISKYHCVDKSPTIVPNFYMTWSIHNICWLCCKQISNWVRFLWKKKSIFSPKELYWDKIGWGKTYMINVIQLRLFNVLSLSGISWNNIDSKYVVIICINAYSYYDPRVKSTGAGFLFNSHIVLSVP